MTERKNRALLVPLVVPYKALENSSKALYGTTGGICSVRFFRPVRFMICDYGSLNSVAKYFTILRTGLASGFSKASISSGGK